ncbi:MAG: hypothetical protein M1823_001467 [Watsoniomyces obsoletus]|nr:MAG: hypothetical protein M1823_001467 [Watsoniomyces obsoletus]
MACRPSPTLLYQAPSHTVYIVGSYIFGGFCLAYAGFNFYSHYLLPPEGLAPWVPIAFGGVCVFMTCFGTWLILAPARLIRTITAIPNPKSIPPSLTLQLHVRRMLILPYRKSTVLNMSPADITLFERLYEQPMTISPDQLEKISPETKQAEENIKGLLRPFQKLGAAWRRMLWSLAKIWTRGGFVKVKVKGKGGVYKVDRDGGWALDEGKALDRLVKVSAG